MQARPNPLMFLPGVLFWALVGVGLWRDDARFLGAGVAVLVIALSVMALRSALRSSARHAEERRVWLEGTAAVAKVLRITAGRSSANDNPLVDFELEVNDGGEPYRTAVSVYVSQLAIPRIQPGCEIVVHVDPKDRMNVVLDEDLTYFGYKT